MRTKFRYFMLMVVFLICKKTNAAPPPPIPIQTVSNETALITAINNVNGYPQNANYEIRITGFINLNNDLPAIVLGNNAGNNKSLIITKDPLFLLGPCGLIRIGGNLSNVSRGFEINNNGNTATALTIRDLEFKDFNLISYTGGGTGGCYIPICIAVNKANIVTIQTCTFTNHATAILFNNNSKNLTIVNNSFVTLGTVPSPCGNNNNATIYYNNGAIAQNAPNPIGQSASTPTSQTSITNNTFVLTGVNYSFHYTYAIHIDPWDYFSAPSNPFTSNYNAKATYTISNNKINNYPVGILQGNTPTIRNSVDLTYSLSIFSNNINCYRTNIVLASPYRHFVLTTNTLNLLYSNAFNPTGEYSHLTFGGGAITSGLQSSQLPHFNNKYGFDIIGNNSFFKTPVNNTNVFNTNSSAINPNIAFSGNYGDKTGVTPSFNDGANVIGINYPGNIIVDAGINTNIRECLLKTGANFPFTQKPITLANIILPQVNEILIGNGNISTPVIQDAYYDGVLLHVAFDLNGNQIVPPNGPFVVEFFKANSNNELVKYLGNQTINTLGNFTYSVALTATVPIGTPPLFVNGGGERIAITVTSLGTNSAPTKNPMGTSEVGYYNIPVCLDCLGDFAPEPGKKYIAGAWVKRKSATGPIASYNAAIKFFFYNTTPPNMPVLIGSPLVLVPTGPLTDGWQKIEGEVQVPANATSMKMQLTATPGPAATGSIYFDDIRFFPYNSTMKSYAYDPNNMRLMAELDERNFATFYEYDEEGKLIRVKKETELGIMTIKESRNSKPIKND